MKHFGSIMDFTKERNDDLMRAFRRQLALAKFVVTSEIFELVAESPSSRFWISEERASIVISAMIAGKPFPRMREKKREMIQEIYRRFLSERAKYPNKSVFAIVSEIVNQPAPKFYMTPRTAGELIYRIKNGWYTKQHDRHRKNTERK